MKAKELKELKEMSVADLEKKLKALKEEIFALRFQHATKQLENPMRITMVRKDIARVKTILLEKQING